MKQIVIEFITEHSDAFFTFLATAASAWVKRAIDLKKIKRDQDDYQRYK